MKLEDEIRYWINMYCTTIHPDNREDLIHHIMDTFGIRCAKMLHENIMREEEK